MNVQDQVMSELARAKLLTKMRFNAKVSGAETASAGLPG